VKTIPPNPDIIAVARRVIWFEPPEQASKDVIRFLAYVMTYATVDDLAIVWRYFDMSDIKEALDHAPPGIIDNRSWWYWHAMVGRYPPPPLPKRILP
jgi:hypothetical protein